MRGNDKKKLPELTARHEVYVSAFLISLIRKQHAIERGIPGKRKFF